MNKNLIKFFQGELSAADTDKLLDAIEKDKTLKEEFINMQNIYALSKLASSSVDNEEGKKGLKLFYTKANKIKNRNIVIRMFQYAAIITILITSTFFFTKFYYDLKESSENNILYVPAGQRAKISLQDGTTVWLNAKSTLKYPAKFSRHNRKVEVIGEAYFDVAKDKKKPFIVSSQAIEIKVLGTQFNIHSYPESGFIATDLIEGSLMVYDKNFKHEFITLKPNQQATYKLGKMYLSSTKHKDYFLWRDGIYAFENERLNDILEKLQLYYDIKINIVDAKLVDTRYTGKFRQRDGIDEILRIIQKIQPFNIKKDMENNIITLSKQ